MVQHLNLNQIPFNFRKVSNQTEYEIEKNDWLRNTYFNYINSQYSGYDYIFNSDKIKPQYLKITGSSTGVIKTVGIITGGTQYQVNDSVFLIIKEQEGLVPERLCLELMVKK